MSLPDYSEYLKQPGMLAYIEQEWKLKPEIHDNQAEIVNEIVRRFKIVSLTEVGCSTGNLASRLKIKFYQGVDSNIDSIECAKIKCPDKEFNVVDIRELKGGHDTLVICFAFLKHFGLHEWSNIFNKIASIGNYFIFDMPIAYETKDDGTEFHHVWKSKQDIINDIKAAGLELLEIFNPASVEPIFVCKKKEKIL